MKDNCWEHMKCGEKETCPAYKEARLNNVHGGFNSGRACWLIAGSMSGEDPHCRFAEDAGTCRNCEFYRHVKAEEGPGFQFSVTLLHLVHNE